MRFNGTNIEAWCGETDAFNVSVVDKTTGDPIPFVAGDTVYFTVKTDVNDETTLQFQREITTFVDGKARVVINHEDTINMMPRIYQYDVWLYKADGQAFPVVELSTLTLERGATRE